MAQWKPDPSFYPSPKMAMQAPPERHGYVADQLRFDLGSVSAYSGGNCAVYGNLA